MFLNTKHDNSDTDTIVFKISKINSMFRRESADVRPYDATEEYHKIGFSASLVFSPARVDWSIDRALDALRRMRPLASPRDQGRILGAPPAPGADTLILVLFLFGLRHYSLERLR